MMSKPKLSAALNNCALHAFVPSIKAQVLAYSTDSTSENPHKKQYELLKDTFAEVYGFDKNKFSFAQFSALLKKYNEHDSQIILGPVLRQFMKSSAKNVDEDNLLALAVASDKENVDSYISSLTDISPHAGRYESLSPQEVALFIGQPLGVQASYSSGSTINKLPAVEHPMDSIVLYHSGGAEGAAAGGHWELSRDAADIDASSAKKSQFQDITNVFTEGSEQLSQCGLTLLKAHVQLTAMGSRSLLERLNDKAHELSTDLSEGIIPEPTVVSEWSADLLQRAQKRTSVEKRVLFPNEQAFIDASVKEQKETLGVGLTARYKEELENLFSKRGEIQEKAANTVGKEGSLSDEELAAKLQAEEFEKAGFKPF